MVTGPLGSGLLPRLASDRLALSPEPGGGAIYRRRLANLVDGALGDLFGEACERTGHTGEGIALAVVGSQGRRDAGPASDLDCVLVHDGRDVAEFARAIWYPLWDAGLPLDHSVRTVPECGRIASDDMIAAVGFLDLRRVAGDSALSAGAVHSVRTRWMRSAHRFGAELSDSLKRRAEFFGALADVPEPDLKEARGGLRDAVIAKALAAMGRVAPPGRSFGRAVEDLLDVRDALQRVTGRHSNRLALADQADVARLFGRRETAGRGRSRMRIDGDQPECLREILADAARVVDGTLDVMIDDFGRRRWFVR